MESGGQREMQMKEENQVTDVSEFQEWSREDEMWGRIMPHMKVWHVLL